MKYTGRQSSLAVLCLSGLIGFVLFGDHYLNNIAAGPLLPAAPTFTQLKQLIASDGEGSDQFGWAVAIDGDIAVVGAIADDDTDGTRDQGSAYIFERNQGGTNNWGQIKRLTALDGDIDDVFGVSVAISGDKIVVGASADNIGANIDQGSAYIFERNAGGLNNWGQVQKLIASDGNANDEFGYSVSIYNDTVIAGSNFDDIGASNQGSVYIFQQNQGGADNWGQVKKLVASDSAANDQFGLSVAINNETVIVGAFSDDAGANSDQGSAYIFERNQGGSNNWGQVTKLVASDGLAGDFFGFSVSIDSDTAVVASPFDDTGTNSTQGAAYIFGRNSGGPNNWGQTKKLTASDGAANDGLGRSVSVFGDMVFVGAVGDNMGQGSCYIFERNNGGPNNWGQLQKLIASDGVPSDQFGHFVAVNNGTAIIGAWSNNIGVNVTQGSAYIFSAVSPTAALVTVSGRVMTSGGTGINNALVRVTDQNGGIRESRTNVFGYYVFEEVEAGQVYVFDVNSKAYKFEPKLVTVGETINDLNFTAGP